MCGIEIGEARYCGVELQFDGAGRAVALFADDDLRLALHAFTFGQPFGEFFPVRLRGLAHLVIIFLAEHEQHDVGILLDRARLAQVGKLRTFIIAAFDLARQLRQRQDRNVKILGERLEPRGNFRDFLHAAFAATTVRALQKLKIVDHKEIEPALAFQPPRPRRQLADRKTAGLIDIERQVLQFNRQRP